VFRCCSFGKPWYQETARDLRLQNHVLGKTGPKWSSNNLQNHGTVFQNYEKTVYPLGGGFFPLRVYALTLLLIGFALRSVQTHILKQFRIEMCVCTLLEANTMGGRLRAYALKGKINYY
jgi:hypothetical protein